MKVWKAATVLAASLKPLHDGRLMPIQAGLLLMFAAAVPACLVAWGFGYAVRRKATSWGLMDKPDPRKIHETPVPLGGGLAIWLGVIGTFAAVQAVLLLASAVPGLIAYVPEFARPHLAGLASKAIDLWVLLGCATVLMLLGLWDDRKGVHWTIRLAIEIAVAAFCVGWQDARLTIFIDTPVLTWGLSVLWIVALINSFNMLDNMDAASGGVAAIIAVMLAVFLLFPPADSKIAPQLFVGGFLMVLAGSLFGFLWHNRPPAKLFMGDAGAYFIGFYIAIATLLATFTTYQSPRPHAVLAPLCITAVPLYDMLTVIWIRVRQGQSLVQADKNHFSHRLVELGFGRTQAVLMIYLTTLTCGLAALLLHRVDLAGAVIVVLVVLCAMAIINILETMARRKIQQ